MKHESTEPLYCWNFHLADEPPGPAFGDAAESIERLGGDPWSFARIAPGTEAIFGAVVITEFVVTGAREQLEFLPAAQARQTGRTLPGPRPVAPAAAAEFK
jgi:hypothetical protein